MNDKLNICNADITLSFRITKLCCKKILQTKSKIDLKHDKIRLVFDYAARVADDGTMTSPRKSRDRRYPLAGT